MCKTLSPKISINHSIVHSIYHINKGDWESVLKNQNIYLSFEYLRALEESMKSDMSFFYIISYDHEQNPLLISYFQLVTFKDKRNNNTQKLLKHLGKSDGEHVSINLLVGGNVFADGENGFIKASTLSNQDAIREVTSIAQEIKSDLKRQQKLSIILFKDFFPTSNEYSIYFKNQCYASFMLDVNMVMSIDPNWQDMGGYLSSLKAKFRTRANKTFKKSTDLVIKSLSVKEILDQNKHILNLFVNVLNKSDFNYGTIKPVAFAKIKEGLKDNFSFRAFFYLDKLVGFSTAFFHKNIMEANYVGLDYTYNYDLDIYQRILLDYTEQAILKEAHELHLGRTSELIKSALGAKPINMTLYGKHKNFISNLLLKPVFNSISPSDYELRKPFKKTD